MTEVDYGGGGHRTRLKDQLINLCVYGVPPPPYIKEWRRGRAGPPMACPMGSPTPTGSRIPPSLVGLGENEGGEREEGKGGAAPLLVQFGLEGEGARGLPWPPLLFSTKAQ